ncbi:MAG: 4Fe-4S binding protein [Clostridiales bacterium]|nr:4Fe-4S binding protein [Clostridiales bacterium]
MLNFDKADCKNCYKCLRVCPTKAIRIKNEQAECVEKLCIDCGKCLDVCPQDAIKTVSEIENVKNAIRSGRNVIASVAPSFAGLVKGEEVGLFVTALKKLGFSYIEETAIGANHVANLYKNYSEEKDSKNIIATCCPSANLLIEQYYPSLIKYIMPYVTPMIAHGKVLKNRFGTDCYVVFIGPCPAKKNEAKDHRHKNDIDAVLTFDELYKWLEQRGVLLYELDSNETNETNQTNQTNEMVQKRGAAFPIRGGVLASFIANGSEKYEVIHADGIEECIAVFDSMVSESISGVCVEPNVCRGSCIGGVGYPKNEKDYFKRFKRVKEYVKNLEKSNINEGNNMHQNIDCSKEFINKLQDKNVAPEEIINAIMSKMGKHDVSDELNCTTCGYDTCRDKAQAVYDGMAEVNMCLPFMRTKAESLSNVMFENSPNIIIIVDDELMVKEYNPKAEETFHIRVKHMIDRPVSIILDEDPFIEVLNNKKDIIGRKKTYPEYDVTLVQSLSYLKDQNKVLTILTDITALEEQKEEMIRAKESTINAAQKVIEKQMRVAQEIASLLGETTAETKVTLTKLKNVFIDGGVK